jgi:hypothetical protein
MPVYIVTGKLGGGKTLGAVDQINRALVKGLKVATNLDLSLLNFPSITGRTMNARVVRIPDKPTARDLDALGWGMSGVSSQEEAVRKYNEDLFGCLVLDECGTWLNAREWNDDGRRELLEFFVHARKRLWNLYLIIQDIGMLDKQVKRAIAEHVVYCRRMDRISIPLLTTLSKLIFEKPLTFPRMHIGHVKYGDNPQSMTVDKWWYRGDDLFRAYNTAQVFSADYDVGPYSYLPPGYWLPYRRAKRNLRFFMRLTKIYLRQYSRTLLLAAGVWFGGVVVTACAPKQPEPLPEKAAIVNTGEYTKPRPLGPGSGFDSSKPEAGAAALASLRLHSVFSGHRGTLLTFEQNGRVVHQSELQEKGYRIVKAGNCRWRIEHGSDFIIVGCWDTGAPSPL